jgi:hypothetical protein
MAHNDEGEGNVQLLSCDGLCQEVLPAEVAYQSETIRQIMNVGSFKEASCRQVRFGEISGSVLKTIVAYLQVAHEGKTFKFDDVQPSLLLDVMMGAHYLDLAPLVGRCVEGICRHIDHFSSFGDLPDFLVELLLPKLGVDGLYTIEEIIEAEKRDISLRDAWRQMYLKDLGLPVPRNLNSVKRKCTQIFFEKMVRDFIPKSGTQSEAIDKADANFLLGAKQFAPKLSEFTLKNSHLKKHHLYALIASLTSASRIDFSGNRIETLQGISVARALRGLPKCGDRFKHISGLDMAHTSITADGARVIFAALGGVSGSRVHSLSVSDSSSRESMWGDSSTLPSYSTDLHRSSSSSFRLLPSSASQLHLERIKMGSAAVFEHSVSDHEPAGSNQLPGIASSSKTIKRFQNSGIIRLKQEKDLSSKENKCEQGRKNYSDENNLRLPVMGMPFIKQDDDATLGSQSARSHSDNLQRRNKNHAHKTRVPLTARRENPREEQKQVPSKSLDTDLRQCLSLVSTASKRGHVKSGRQQRSLPKEFHHFPPPRKFPKDPSGSMSMLPRLKKDPPEIQPLQPMVSQDDVEHRDKRLVKALELANYHRKEINRIPIHYRHQKGTHKPLLSPPTKNAPSNVLEYVKSYTTCTQRTATAGIEVKRKKLRKRTTTAGDVQGIRDESIDSTFLTSVDFGHENEANVDSGLFFSIRQNPIGDIAAKAFADMLFHNPGDLVHLDLSGNEIGEVGASCIAEAMRSQARIQKLILRSSRLGGKGLRAIAEGLAKNATIVHCDLCDNTNDPGKGGADDIGTGSSLQKLLEKNSTLKFLVLASNHLKVSHEFDSNTSFIVIAECNIRVLILSICCAG